MTQSCKPDVILSKKSTLVGNLSSNNFNLFYRTDMTNTQISSLVLSLEFIDTF